jgi:glycosyltransferase involved in cell wall biosynthesis
MATRGMGVAMERALTVLVPNYNSARYLPSTLATLLAQTLRDFSLIVLDNRSTDGAAEAAQAISDPRLRVVCANEHVGMVANWNRALELVDTPFFALCHSDDLYEPTYLKVLLRLLQGHPSAFIAHCKVTTIDENAEVTHSPAESYKDSFWPADDPYERSQRDELQALRRGNYILMPAVMYRTEAVRRIGTFREEFSFAADWDYWLRGVLAGYTIVGTHQRLVRYRRHPEMTTRQTEANLARYRDEIAIPKWVAAAAHDAGLSDNDKPNFEITVNSLLTHFAAKLVRGDKTGAGTLLRFAEQNIPTFPASAKHRAARLALRLGRIGGLAFKIAEKSYLRLIRSRWHAPPNRRAGS